MIAVQPTAPSAENVNESGEEERSLIWLLSHSKPPTQCHFEYDLERRPEMAVETWERLQAGIEGIPPMPEIWLEVQEILEEPDASASDLGRCIARDPILTSRILRVCNSVMYAAAGSSEVTNIPLALARLGMEEATSIIFQSLVPALGANGSRGKEVRHIWFHGQAIARLSCILAESSYRLDRHAASLVGMLHDIGKLAIVSIEPLDRLDQVKERIDQGTPALTAEFEVLGYTHIDAGIILGEHWHLPVHIQQIIAYHHHAAIFDIDRLPKELRHAMMILHLAHLLLDHFSDADREEELSTIWQENHRTLPHEALRFIRQEMNLSLGSQVLYGQLREEIERVKQAFPTLFHHAE